MLLITETHQDDLKMIKESNADGTPQYYIEGIYMQAEKENKNGRLYPADVLLKEADRYDSEFVQKNRALGELGHPEGPTVNLDKVSHCIKELWVDGNNVYGKAKILETPMGDIVAGLIKEGISIGVSTRGMGSLEKKDKVNVVQDDFVLSAVDIVADPSAPDAFVDGIMEGKEWVWENGLIKCVEIEKHKNLIENAARGEDREKEIFRAFYKLFG
jgi:hypothetical protein